MQKMKEIENENERLKLRITENSKKIQDRTQEYNLLLIENDALQNHISTMSSQYKALLNENEHLKDELFDLKQENLELKQEVMNSRLNVEKYERDASHLQAMLQKSEKNFSVITFNY